MSKTKKVATFGIGIALYVVLGCAMNIPLLAGSHLQTDLGYIVFGAFCYLFGWEAFIIGTLGCIAESMLVSGYFPVGWVLGQILIGLLCGFVYTKSNNKIIHIIVSIIAVFLGIAVIKTLIECALFGIPLVVKFPKNCVAFIADVIPMIIGLLTAYKIKKVVLSNNSTENLE